MNVKNEKNNEIEKFLNFESKYCFDYEIDNVLVWKYLREFIYDEYIHKVYNTQNRVPSYSNFKFGVFFIGQLFRLFSINNDLTHKDIVFLNFPRKTRIDGCYQCPQLEPLIRKFEGNCCILENPFWIEDKSYLVSHFEQKKDNMIYTDKIEILHRLRIILLVLFKRKEFKKKYHKKILYFCNDINNNLCLKIDNDKLINQIFWYISFEKYALNQYRRILKRLSPKCLIEVYTPNHHIALMNTVAHELKIPIIDVQHGAIGEYEPIMYSYHKKYNYPHLSDYIFCFGDYWKKKKNFHVNDKCVIPVGVPFLENQVHKVDNHANIKDTIVIISQARYSKLFYNLAEELQKKFKKTSKKILLKLHPYEYSLYNQGYYRKLIQNGVQVDAGLEKHLYTYFENAQCVIGINSTALYEAITFKIPIYIYNNKYGTENLIELSKSVALIQIFNDVEDLIDKIEQNGKVVMLDDSNDIFSTNAMSRTVMAIKQICDIEIS